MFFKALVGFLASVADLSVNSDVVVATVTKQHTGSDIVFRCRCGNLPRE